jgi:hypothetical protein
MQKSIILFKKKIKIFIFLKFCVSYIIGPKIFEKIIEKKKSIKIKHTSNTYNFSEISLFS